MMKTEYFNLPGGERMILVRAFGGEPPENSSFRVVRGALGEPRVALVTPFIEFRPGDFVRAEASFEITNYTGKPFTAVARLGLVDDRDDVMGSPGWQFIDHDGGGPTLCPGTHFVLQRTGQHVFDMPTPISRRIALAIKCYSSDADGTKYAIWDETDVKLVVTLHS